MKDTITPKLEFILLADKEKEISYLRNCLGESPKPDENVRAGGWVKPLELSSFLHAYYLEGDAHTSLKNAIKYSIKELLELDLTKPSEELTQSIGYIRTQFNKLYGSQFYFERIKDVLALAKKTILHGCKKLDEVIVAYEITFFAGERNKEEFSVAETRYDVLGNFYSYGDHCSRELLEKATVIGGKFKGKELREVKEEILGQMAPQIYSWKCQP